MNTDSLHASDFTRKLTAFLDRDSNVIFAVMLDSAAVAA
jgi:hypothetical protein